MNGTTTTTETHAVHPARENTVAKAAAGGSMMEAIGAIATIALAIVGLAGVFSSTMAAIATIVIGAAILIEGASQSSAQYAARGTVEEARLGGMSAEFLGGIAGIVLGILALLGISQQTLLSVAVLVFGATFLAASLGQAGSQDISMGGHLLVGLGAIVLGILAVIGLDPLVLVLVGLLSLGVSALFSGSTVGTRMFSLAQRTT